MVQTPLYLVFYLSKSKIPCTVRGSARFFHGGLLARLLVTGGAGFIGSHLVDVLIADGHDVVVLDDLSSGSVANIAHHRGASRFRFVRGSILDQALLGALMHDVDGVYHLAALVGVRYVVDDPLLGIRTNVLGTDYVLRQAAQHGIKVLVVSSSEAYGKSSQLPLQEEGDSVIGSTTVPRWSYALSKLLDEHLALAYARQQGLPTVVVRYFNAYGPRLDPRGYGSVVARFISQAMTGKPLTVYGDGQQTRSFTFVSDTVRGTVLAMERPAAEGLVFNIGNPSEISILELAQRVREAVGADVPIEHVPLREVFGPHFEESRRRLPDITRARRILGFEPEVPLGVGLRRTVDWFREHCNEILST